MRRSDLLEPWRPAPDDPWDRAKAAHLAARSGFGANPAEVEALLALGPERAADARVEFPDAEPALEQRMREIGSPLYEESTGVGDPRAWWIYRMCATTHPLREKLTLFWHHHFAVQESEEMPAGLLLRQNELFRRQAAGSFRELLRALARDAAMLIFLDGRINVREKPNENWARELLELFTLGLDRYTQRDVVEVARVFTGWGLGGASGQAFEFHAERHDPGDKLVLGEPIRGRAGAAGVEEGDELLELLLRQPSAAPFLARKLLRWFVEDQPSDELCEACGDVLRANGWSVRDLLRVLFRSRAFYDRGRRASLFKTPVAFTVSAARALELQNAHLLRLERTLRELGMDLFHPPSVAGWDLGPAWIHAGSVLLRARFAEQLAHLPHSARRVTGAPALDFDRLGGVSELGQRLVGRPLSQARLAELSALVDARAGGDARGRTRAAVELVLAAPEFALE